jgi:TonB family protein
MKLLFTLILFMPITLFAQQPNASNKFGKDTTYCPCSYTRTLQYPKRASDNKICGTVIIEIEVDTLGIQSNPKVLKGLGFGCDEAALKMVNIDIVNRNQCRRKCGLKKQQPEKLKQTITFECAEKEYIDD